MKKSRKILLISAIVYVLVMIALYLGVSAYFMTHFFPGSVINGIDCSSKTVKEAEDMIANKVQDYSITIKQKDGREESISGEKMNFSYVSNGQVQALKDSQNPFTWLYAYFNPSNYSMVAKATYDKEALRAGMEQLECFDGAKVVKPQDAKIVKAGSQYTVQNEVVGNELDKEKVYSLLVAAVDQGDASVDLESSDCYLKPEVYASDEALTSKVSVLNKYANMTVTYEFGSSQEVLDSETISQWMKLDENNNVSFDQEGISGFVAELGEKYDTFGRSQPFTTSRGESIMVQNVTYGWEINEEAEREELLGILQKGESVAREPVYLESALARGENDIGDTYVEIDYNYQHMWFYKNGSLVVDTDVVTGNPNKGNESPIGVFNLVDKERNATLVGEDYKTPVDYWMPFYDGVGLHDANWQPVFGGDWYKTNGSHGCINTPINIVSIIFENIEIGTPIVCYMGSTPAASNTPAANQPNTQDTNQGQTDESETKASETKDSGPDAQDTELGDQGTEAGDKGETEPVIPGPDIGEGGEIEPPEQ